jgi:hypothetical protein
MGAVMANTLGAVAGSVASQDVAIGLGLQKDFSAEQVLVSGIAGSITGFASAAEAGVATAAQRAGESSIFTVAKNGAGAFANSYANIVQGAVLNQLSGLLMGNGITEHGLENSLLNLGVSLGANAVLGGKDAQGGLSWSSLFRGVAGAAGGAATALNPSEDHPFSWANLVSQTLNGVVSAVVSDAVSYLPRPFSDPDPSISMSVPGSPMIKGAGSQAGSAALTSRSSQTPGYDESDVSTWSDAKLREYGLWREFKDGQATGMLQLQGDDGIQTIDPGGARAMFGNTPDEATQRRVDEQTLGPIDDAQRAADGFEGDESASANAVSGGPHGLPIILWPMPETGARGTAVSVPGLPTRRTIGSPPDVPILRTPLASSANGPITLEAVIADLQARGPEGATLAQGARERMRIINAPLGDRSLGYASKRTSEGLGLATLYGNNIAREAQLFGVDPVAYAAEIGAHELTHTNQDAGPRTLEDEVEANLTQLRVFRDGILHRFGLTTAPAIRGWLDGHRGYVDYERGPAWFADDHHITNPVFNPSGSPPDITLPENMARNPIQTGIDANGNATHTELVQRADGTWGRRQATEFSEEITAVDIPVFRPEASSPVPRSAPAPMKAFTGAYNVLGNIDVIGTFGDQIADKQYGDAVGTAALTAFSYGLARVNPALSIPMIAVAAQGEFEAHREELEANGFSVADRFADSPLATLVSAPLANISYGGNSLFGGWIGGSHVANVATFNAVTGMIPRAIDRLQTWSSVIEQANKGDGYVPGSWH